MVMDNLQALSQLSRQIIASAQEGIIVYGSDLRYLLWNPFMEQLTGLNSDDVIGRHPLEVLPFLVDVGVIERLEKALCGETVPAIEFPYDFPKFDKSGWASDTSFPLLNNEGEIIGVIGIVKGITAQKKTERMLQDSLERFSRLAENSQDMIYRMSLPDGRYEYVSPASIKIFGYTPEEFYHSPALIKQMIHPDWQDYLATQWQKLLAGDMPPIYEYQIIHKSGEMKWLNQRNTLMKDDSDTPVYIEGIVTDITEQKLTEENLSKIKADLQNTIDISPGLICVANINTGYFTKTNLAATTILGYSEAELTAKPLIEFVHPDDRERTIQEVSKQLDGNSIANFQNRYQCKDGSYKWLAWGGSRVDNDGNVYAVATDVTQLKHAEAELQQTNALLSMFMEHSPIYTFLKRVTPTESRVLMASENYENMIGIPGSKMAGKTMAELFPAELASRMTADDQDVVSRNEIQEIEEELNGRIYTSIKFPIQQETSSLLAGYTIDITERKLAEEDLVKSKQLLTKMGQTSKVGGWEFNIDTESLLWTEEVYHIHEVGLDYVPTVKNALDFYSDTSKPAIADAVQRVIEHGEPFDLELEIITGNGNHRSVHALGVADREYRRVHGVLQDITDRKKIEDELRRHRESLDELVAERTEQLSKALKLMTGREIRMVELKKSIDRLGAQLSAAGITPEINSSYGEPSSK